MFINWSPIRKLIWLKASGAIVPDLPWKTITGNPLSFIARTAHALKSCVVGIESVQDLHGQAAPYPPGGGVNKYPECAISGTANTVTVAQNGGSYSLTGTASAYSQFISSDTFTLPAGTYTLKEFNWIPGLYIQLRSENGQTTYANTAGGETNTFTLANDTTLKARIVVNADIVTNRTIQIEIVSGSTAPSAFSPYSNICPISGFTGANVYVESAYDPSADPKVSVSWQSSAGTVYGGTLDVTTGVLTATKKYVKYTGAANESWSIVQNSNRVYTSVSDIATDVSDGSVGSILSNMYKSGAYNATSSGARITMSSGVTQFNIFDPQNITSGSTTTTWKDFLAQNNLEVVYPLATPQTYQLTAQQVSAIVGENNMWTDCATLTVEAKAMD